MNFQSVSTAQKLPTSDGLAGGYLADGTPGPLLRRALSFVNGQVVTPENPTPAGPATLVYPRGSQVAPPRGPWVKIRCTDGLADAPSTDK